MLNEFGNRPAIFIGNQTVCHSAKISHTRTLICTPVDIVSEASPSRLASQSNIERFGDALLESAPASLAWSADTSVAVLQFLEYYGLPQHSITKWEYLGIEFLFFIMFFFLAWTALKYKKHGNR